jgi:hypothetical protein
VACCAASARLGAAHILRLLPTSRPQSGLSIDATHTHYRVLFDTPSYTSHTLLRASAWHTVHKTESWQTLPNLKTPTPIGRVCASITHTRCYHVPPGAKGRDVPPACGPVGAHKTPPPRSVLPLAPALGRPWSPARPLRPPAAIPAAIAADCGPVNRLILSIRTCPHHSVPRQPRQGAAFPCLLVRAAFSRWVHLAVHGRWAHRRPARPTAVAGPDLVSGMHDCSWHAGTAGKGAAATTRPSGHVLSAFLLASGRHRLKRPPLTHAMCLHLRHQRF